MDFQSDTSSDAGHDNMSCCSYSSGWERSSSSEYLDTTTDNEDDIIDTTTDNEAEDIVDSNKDQEAILIRKNLWRQPQSTGGTKLFDMEYKCELVSLTHKNQIPHLDHDTDSDSIDPITLTTETITNTENPWKKPTSPITNIDPWAFLDSLNKPEIKKTINNRHNNNQHRNSNNNHHHQHQHHRQQPQQQPPRSTIDNSNTNKLCKYKNDCRMNKNKSCNMIHSLQEWKPRVCRFNKGCRRKNQCGYYHTDMPLNEYLRILIITEDTIYAKNAALYQKYL